MTDRKMDLVSAVRSQGFDAVRLLLESGADADQADDYGWTPLCWAAAQGNVEIAQGLLDRGADPSGVERMSGLPI
jgi:ankyrin repeat protein